jgi:hypothetical protein
VGGTPSVLSPRAAIGGTLFVLLVVYYEISTHLWVTSEWWNVLWLGAVLMPAVFGLELCALGLRDSRHLLPVGLAAAALAAVLTVADADVWANFARLAATVAIGWWFLGYFETVGWTVLVACIIPWIDAYSVWRGPTKSIVSHHVDVFNVLSFAFPLTGRVVPYGLTVAADAIGRGEPLSEHGLAQIDGLAPFQAAANLGVPDLLFFALFLAAAARFGLRVYWTWAAMVALLAGTIAFTVWLDLDGLPALPAVALGFLVPNADLLWRRLRGEPGLGDRPQVAVDRPAHDA